MNVGVMGLILVLVLALLGTMYLMWHSRDLFDRDGHDDDDGSSGDDEEES